MALNDKVLILQKKVRNPNDKKNRKPLFSTILVILCTIGIISENVYVLMMPFLYIIFTFYLLYREEKRKDALLTIYKLDENAFSLCLEGKNLEYKIEGNLSYEIWRKPIAGENQREILNYPQLALFTQEAPQLLIRTFGSTKKELKKHENWGYIKEASTRPAEVIIDMEVNEMAEIRAVLEKNKMTMHRLG